MQGNILCLGPYSGNPNFGKYPFVYAVFVQATRQWGE